MSVKSSKPSLKTYYAQGSVKAKVSLDSRPFVSEGVTIWSGGSYSVVRADLQSRLQLLQFNLDNNIQAGTHNLGSGPDETIAYFYHYNGEFGWSYFAETGTLNITDVDLERQLLKATFKFESPGMEPGDPPVKVTEGEIDLTGARGKTR
ncbi:hypothetical protein [Pseudomonas gessardii]|uniref:hypothetical protein n=1 Tax=Pseudomonas gessardii TaxID=78544 RepID=UPI0014746BB8|nr:hypothetical protein [Pseudomonas gessardii]NNA69693.1 hypothetical protein [Pseudomonas gessardii]